MKVVEYWYGTIKNYRYDGDISTCTTHHARYVDDSQSRRVCWSLVTCMDKLIFRVMQGLSRQQRRGLHQRLYNTSLVLSLVSLSLSLPSINSPDLRGRGVCLWSVLNCGPTCVSATSRPKRFCIYYYYSTHRLLSSMHLEY